MRIGPVDLDHDVLVVAEIGNNHEGDVDLAEEMIHLAAEAGAQAVKFQSIVPERLVAPDQETRLAQLRHFQLSPDDHRRLAAAATKVGAMFISTPFSVDVVTMLQPLVASFKIASGDNDYVALLNAVARTAKPILISTGMTDIESVRLARDVVRRAWSADGVNPGLVLMHCVSAYPTPPAEANLRAIRNLTSLGETVGYSDHTLGIEAAVLAVALGARVIEKHFTIAKDRSDFRDHALSADPGDLKLLVRRIREANEMLGDGRKRVMPSEGPVAAAARRSACAARDLPQGHLLTADNLLWLRPAGALAPSQECLVVGHRLRHPVSAYQRLSIDMVE